MGFSQDLDVNSESKVIIKLFKNVKNVPELRQKLLAGDLECCIVRPELILDPFQIVVAANKAVTAEKLTTKTLYTEILFNLSISKNIMQSLQRFGVDDKASNILLVVIERDTTSSKAIFEAVAGEECELKDLCDFSDMKLIKKEYKISDAIKELNVLDVIVSKIATKDC